jgi:four helix bundle protein
MPRAYQGATTQTYRKLYGYKKLVVWQRADDLAAIIHTYTTRFGPGYYRLSDQMRSAAVSVKSNIAEGYCRAAFGDYIRFCEIARGSLGELAELLELFSETTLLLERLITGLIRKRETGEWDKNFGVKETGSIYQVEDADQTFELPEEIDGTEGNRLF